jgi:hypothetical protein
LLTVEQGFGCNDFVMKRAAERDVTPGLSAMPHFLSALLVRPARATACLVGAGALLLLVGGVDSRGDAADADPALRHETAVRAINHLDALRGLTLHLGELGPALDQGLKQARGALGAEMIALRELARPGDEEAAVRGTLAVLALYQTAWIDARDRARSGDAEGAGEALAAAMPLGVQATAALASLGHIMDDGNLATIRARAADDRAGRLWNAGLALVAAGMLLFAAARLQGATIRRAGLAG